MVAKDLRVEAPRRWSEELGGIRWLPRMIDKARAAMRGKLGDYLYGQSPMDRSFLRAIGLSYKEFSAIVRQAGNDDDRVFALISERAPHGLNLVRRWSDELPKRYRFFLYLIDVDDGYVEAPPLLTRSVMRFFSALGARYRRYQSPAESGVIETEVDAQQAAEKAQAARGAEEEPYRWLTAQTLDFSWKLLLSVLLIFLLFGYVMRFVERIGIIFLVIVGAIFFAYLIYPLVRWLNKRLPLIAAILLIYACIAGLVTLGLMYLIPAVTSEATTLIHAWPSIQAKISAYINDPHNRLLAHMPPDVRNGISHLPQDTIRWIQSYGTMAFGNAVKVLIGTAAFIGTCVAIPVLAAYLLHDSEAIKRFFLGFIPGKRRESTLELLSQLEQVIGGFIRGQILVGASVGTLIAIGLFLIGEPYAILFGVAAGALDLIPYIGPVIAAVPAVILAFVTGGTPLFIKVIVVFVLANQAEGHLIAPNVVSRTIQLSPSAVVIAILIGGELYGVLGMFMAIPVAGIIRVLLLHVVPGSVSRDEAKPVLTKDPRESAEEAAAP
jgi:predicted PurR-regulated permease PerM